MLLVCYNSQGVICRDKLEKGRFSTPPFCSSDGFYVGVAGAVMICHYVSQPKDTKTQMSAQNVKCPRSRVCHSISSVCFFFYWIAGVRKEKERKEESEMERDGRIRRRCEMQAEILVINGRVESRDKNCRAEGRVIDSDDLSRQSMLLWWPVAGPIMGSCRRKLFFWEWRLWWCFSPQVC